MIAHKPVLKPIPVSPKNIGIAKLLESSPSTSSYQTENESISPIKRQNKQVLLLVTSLADVEFYSVSSFLGFVSENYRKTKKNTCLKKSCQTKIQRS